MVLDIVKVPVSHTGLNLARVFARVLDEFGISDKVSSIPGLNIKYLSLGSPDPLDNM